MLPSHVPRTAGAHGFAHSSSTHTRINSVTSIVVPSAQGGGGPQTSSRAVGEQHTVKLLPRPQHPAVKTAASNSNSKRNKKKKQGKLLGHSPNPGKQENPLQSSFKQPKDRSGQSRDKHKNKLKRPERKQSQHRQQPEGGHKQLSARQEHTMQEKQPQPTGQQLVHFSTAAKAAAATAAAATAVEQTRQLLASSSLRDDNSSSIKTPDATSSTSRATSSDSCSSSNNAERQKASIHYKLPPHAYQEYRAAGVVVYDCDDPGCAGSALPEVKVLLVRELGEVWCLPAGKLNKALDSPQCPESTAARELEEETHGLIPAAVSQAVLAGCPQMYWKDGKMVLYFMMCRGGQRLPQMAAARLAAGRGHEAAAKIDQLAWMPLKSIISGRGGRGLEKSIRIRYNAKAATTAAAAAVEAEVGAAVAAAAGPVQPEGPHPQAVPAPSAALLANASSAHQQQQQQQLSSQAAEQATAAGASALHQQQPSDHLQDPAQGQQQQEADIGRIRMRPTLVINKHSISKWLCALVTGQTPTPGLQVQPLQQDGQVQQRPATELLQDPVIQVLAQVPAAETASSSSSGAAQLNARGSAPVSSSISGSSASAIVLSAAATASAAAAAALRAAGISGGGSGAPSTGLIGDQPWALSIWSGRHEQEAALAESKGSEPGSRMEQKGQGLALV